jgi:hypothetical protein
MADGLSTDFDQIYLDNAEKVETIDGGQSLELETKIIISRNPDGKYLALDGSPHGPIGCVLQLTVQSTAVVQLCPDSATAEQKATLTSNLDRIADFYALNNVPARPVEEVKAGIDDALGALTTRLASLECKVDEIDKFKQFLGGLINDDTQQELSASLATPRLPVVQPCL